MRGSLTKHEKTVGIVVIVVAVIAGFGLSKLLDYVMTLI